ncbi:MAG: glycosyltransferase family 9 protein, partial [Bacteroidota bacterium]
MNVNVMRGIDRFVGIPLCLLVGFISRWRPRHEPKTPLQTILIIKFFGLGSVLLSTPLLSSLKYRFPDSRILYLTFSHNRELLDKLPQPTDRLIISTSSALAFVRDTFAVLRFLRQQRIDIVFDLEFFSKFSTLISTLSNAPIRVGYELPTRWRQHNVTHHIPLDHSAHVVDVFLRQLSALNISPDTDAIITPILPSAEERRSATRKLGLGTNGFEIVCVNINAGTTSLERRWPPERFLRVVEIMLSQGQERRFFF